MKITSISDVFVSLLGEGVDWNLSVFIVNWNQSVSLLGEGVDWNSALTCNLTCKHVSPSLGREWIEMVVWLLYLFINLVSLLGEGVDWNGLIIKGEIYTAESPSLGREWIEIEFFRKSHKRAEVSLLGEGVDWNIAWKNSVIAFESLPPWGGSGLKYRRWWLCKMDDCLPPWGGSGLK